MNFKKFMFGGVSESLKPDSYNKNMNFKEFMFGGVSESLKPDSYNKNMIKNIILTDNPKDEDSASVVANLLEDMVYDFDNNDTSLIKKISGLRDSLNELNDFTKTEMISIAQSGDLIVNAAVAKNKIQEKAKQLGFVSKTEKVEQNQIKRLENMSDKEYAILLSNVLSGMEYKGGSGNINEKIDQMDTILGDLTDTLKEESIELAKKGLDKESDEFKLGLKQIAQTVRDQAREMGFAAKERKKNVFEHVGGFFKRAGNNLVDGFKAAGSMLKEAGSQFKSGAFFAGIGSTVKGVLAGVGNTMTLGGTTAASKALENSVETTVDANGNVHVSGSNFISKLYANKVEKTSNQLIEIDEAIQEGDIGKANSLGALSIANDVLDASTIAMTGGLAVGAGKLAGKAAGKIASKVATNTAANTAAKVAATTATKITGKKLAGKVVSKAATGIGLFFANQGIACDNMKFSLDLAKDGARDKTDKLLEMFCNKSYIDKNDKENMDKIRDITLQYTNYENGMSEDGYRKLLAMHRDKGDIQISLDFFKEPYINNDDIKNIVNNEITEEANMCEDMIVTALAQRDAYEISYDDCDKQIYAAQYIYENIDAVKNQDVSIDQLKELATLNAEFQHGDMDEETFMLKHYQIINPEVQSESLAGQIVERDNIQTMTDTNISDMSDQTSYDEQTKDTDISITQLCY